jgi:hypothetical protein
MRLGVVIGAVLTLLVLGSASFAQRGSPTPVSPNTDGHASPSSLPPIDVKVVSVPPLGHPSDEPLVLATYVLCAVTGALAVGTFLLYLTAAKLGADAQKAGATALAMARESASIARDAVTISQQTGFTAKRPWLMVSGEHYEVGLDRTVEEGPLPDLYMERINGRVTIRNVGASPAVGVGIRYRIIFKPDQEHGQSSWAAIGEAFELARETQSWPTDDWESTSAEGAVLFPGQQMSLDFRHVGPYAQPPAGQPTPDIRKDINIVVGVVQYRTGLDAELHETPFAFEVDHARLTYGDDSSSRSAGAGDMSVLTPRQLDRARVT